MCAKPNHLFVTVTFIFGFAVCIVQISAWTSIGKIAIKDGKCDPKNGKLYSIGEKWHNNEDCFEITCIQGNKGTVAQQVTSCPVHAMKTGCKLKFPKGEFPNCCPFYDCSKN
uniref:U-scoloptoxin(16)-Sm2a n=1 Tax=Scolopendra morsitans TaxID=943129 RepID=TXG2A_SCOMO|nr:RecName: Full=U-scoloptoxin(16)-Sm2a; Short=U-SLPTX(16)-Sm2a; Flags: Precursor [Scolopendra morsitans]